MPQPFSFELTTERYRTFGDDPATVAEDGRLFRVLDGREVAVARFLGAPFDLDAFARAAAADEVLAGLVERLRGLRPALVPDPFEALVTAITAQQVSLRAASAIRGRFVVAYGERHARAYAFPTRERVATAAPEDLRALGFSTRKAE